tara:strand:+ start:291 stop:500 length:210 start_codon:yes stop_codon:yes gene_type:complete
MKVTLKSTNLQDRTAVECKLEMAGYEHAEIASLLANKAQLKEVIEGLDAAMNLSLEELEKQLGLDGGEK